LGNYLKKGCRGKETGWNFMLKLHDASTKAFASLNQKKLKLQSRVFQLHHAFYIAGW
jgi:hypothetical protein